MGQAREVMDRLMTAIDAKDREALAGCYAADAVIQTPDQGEVSGTVAIVEGFVVGTNTGPLSLPTGGTLPATGRQVRVRSCDVARVEAGLISTHHAYFDQLELLGQLGLLPELSKQ